MVHLFGIYELANPLLGVIPIVLLVYSGYTIGVVISKVRKVNIIFLRHFIYGNIVLNFLFISGFMFFGVLTYEAKEFFTAFTYILVGLSILGVFLLLKKLIVNIIVGNVGVGHGVQSANVKAKIKSLLSLFFLSEGGNNIKNNQSSIFILLESFFL